ncbi:MAG TPA: sigma-70 family RNA polymerase sigma factor [Chitinophagaceae bacterium]|nr:sigma-70 family RNA polymerase sigma factor [Chitinophagaceae bacterium]
MRQNDCLILPDEKIWDLFLTGDTAAFDVLMKRYYQTLFNYGTRFQKDHELVKDHIQELFLSLWKNRKGIRSTLSVKHYLLKAMRRSLCRPTNKSKLVSFSGQAAFDAGFNMILPVEPNLVLQEKLTELSYKVRSVLEKLSRRQQEIIYLRFYMDADIHQIAEIMDLEHQSVYNLLHEALKRFKKLSNADYFLISWNLLLLGGCCLLQEILKNS